MGKFTALVLEDNEFMRDLLVNILSAKNFEVAAFENPKEYLESRDDDLCLNNCPCFDVIIADNTMPEMTGLEFFQQLTDFNCNFPSQHKAIISGNWSTEGKVKAYNLGCRVFDKPFSINIIHEWLDEIIVRLPQQPPS